MQIITTKSTFRLSITCAAFALSVAGCDKTSPEATESIAANSDNVISADATDNWLGKWIGPEGTFLQLSGGDGEYEIIIQKLDGPRTFHGKAVSNHIEFERDGVEESLRATSGAETGMKWLSEKSNCLAVSLGEGYCRD